MVLATAGEVGRYRIGCRHVARVGSGARDDGWIADTALLGRRTRLGRHRDPADEGDGHARHHRDPGIDTVFADLESRYRSQQLNSAAAMAEYLRHHTRTGSERTCVQRLRTCSTRRPAARPEPRIREPRQKVRNLTRSCVKAYMRAAMMQARDHRRTAAAASTRR